MSYTSIIINSSMASTGAPVGISIPNILGKIEINDNYILQFKVRPLNNVYTLDNIYIGSQKLNNVNMKNFETISIEDVVFYDCYINFVANSNMDMPSVVIGRLKTSSDTNNSDIFEITELALYKGTKVKEYEPNNNDIQIVKNQLVTMIEQVSDSITLKAERLEMDTLNNKLDKALGQIYVAAGEISLKASSETVNGLENRINSAEQKITPDAIVSTVTSSSTWKNQETRISTAEQKITPDAIVSTVTSSSTWKNQETRISTAEQKITSSSIVSTVTSSSAWQNQTSQIQQLSSSINMKVSSNNIISSINMSPESIKINTAKLDITGDMDLQGTFKCYKSASNKQSNYLHMTGAMMFGYNDVGGKYPVFASGLWTDENLGYFSVGYTRADVSDVNGCLWISPQQGNNGGQLTFSKTIDNVARFNNIYFNKDGKVHFNNGIYTNPTGDDVYPYQFDGGVTVASLRCDNLRTYNIYPRYSGSSDIGSASMRYKDIFADSLSTTNNQLRLGTVTSTGAWGTYGALDINSKDGYVYPDKGTGQLSLGTSSMRFHTIYLVNSPNVSSDKRVKTDIHYLDEPVEETNIIDSEVPRVERNMKITTKDMYDFVKDDLKLASYRYNNNLDRNITSVDYGFIAQDILYTKVGSEIVQLADKEDLDSELAYNQSNYISTIAGALQEEIIIRDKQIDDLQSQINELKEILNEKGE